MVGNERGNKRGMKARETFSGKEKSPYHLVEEAKNWTEAQSYCREKYTDLATIDNEEDMAKLNVITSRNYDSQVWIGLYDDINSWKWSLESKGYYGEGQAEFRIWDSAIFHNVYYATCGLMNQAGKWGDGSCDAILRFICYMAQDASRFIYVEEAKNWTEAQSYCREHYTDLVSVRNQTENDEVHRLAIDDHYVWIGLFRDSWKCGEL
ncbi:lithostathine-like [Centroberyx gerrardi]